MSKIGNKVIEIPKNVNVSISNNLVNVKGPKGELNIEIKNDKISIEIEDNKLYVKRKTDEKSIKSLHGLYNALITNAIKGVLEMFQVKLSLVGVGYRAQKKDNGLTMSLGFSHPVEIKETKDISFVLEGDTNIIVQGVSKQLVGQVASDIRKIRSPEPYKGKGVRYANENIKRKAGKAGKK